MFPACVFLFHSECADICQTKRGASIQCAQPALAWWNLAESCVFSDQEGGSLHLEFVNKNVSWRKSSKRMSNTDMIANAETMSNSQPRPVVCLRVCCTHGSSAETAKKKKSRRARSRTTSSADDGLFQGRFLLQELIFAHSEFFSRLALPGTLLNKEDWCASRTAACACECGFCSVFFLR